MAKDNVDPFDLNPHQDFEIEGEGGGGGKGGGGGRTPIEDPNTLQSKSIAAFVELLGEGENVGLVNGLKSVYLDNTPIQNADNSFNFEGITWQERTGTVDQAPLSGIPTAENEVNVNTEVTNGTPIVRTVTDATLDAVRVRIFIPALYEVINTGENAGDILKYSVKYRIEVQENGGSYVNSLGDITIDGKTTSGYEAAYRITLPAGGAPWNIRVTRISPDDADANKFSQTFFQAYTEIRDEKYSYPYCHLIGVQVDTAYFGTSLPSRTYHVKGRIVEVPVNYDPVARTYTGMWNGTFKLAWTDNPAWCYRDLLLNNRYGLGRVLSASQIDDGTLYTISQYCDELVDDGFGGTEPRFTCNLVINSQEEAYQVVNDMASIFRGLTFWSAGSLSLTYDAPQDPDRIVTNANVIDGEFVWSSTSLRSRKNAVIVAYNNPADLGRQALEIAQSNVSIAKYGYRSKSTTAFGCTSRGQAKRLARWLLLTELQETEAVVYRSGDDHAWVTPGTIIQVLDRDKLSVRWGGRAVSYSGTSVTLDEAPTLGTPADYVFVYMDASMNKVEVDITGKTGDTLTLASALPDDLDPNFVWGIMEDVADPEVIPIRVISTSEVEPGVFEIAGVTYFGDKFTQIDNGINFDDLPDGALPANKLEAPTNLAIIFGAVSKSGTTSSIRATLSWRPPSDQRVTGYEIEISRQGDGWERVARQTKLSREFVDLIENDTYNWRVRARSDDGKYSNWVELGDTVAAGRTTAADGVSGLTATDSKTGILLRWTNPTEPGLKTLKIYRSNDSNSANATLLDEIVSTKFLDQTVSKGATYYYWIETVIHDPNAPDSAWVGPVNATFTGVASGDLGDDLTSSAVPGGLAVNTVNQSDAQTRLTATWNSATGAASYHVGLTLNGGNEVIYPVAGTRFELDIRPLDTYSVRVRGVSAIETVSAWTSPVAGTAAADTVPPAAPTGLSGTGGFNTVWLEWTENSETDMSHYEVYHNAAGTGTPGASPAGTQLKRTFGASYIYEGLADNYNRDYYVRAVDKSGNKSSWSTSENVVTTDGVDITVTAEDIQGIVDDTSFAAGIEPIKVVSSLPSVSGYTGPNLVFLTTDATVYRYTGSAWTKAVATSDLTGQITSTQITDNAITTPKINTGAIDTTKLAADAVTADKLAANSVVAGSIQAGAVGANQIAANAIVASKIAIGDFNNLAPDGSFTENLNEVWSNNGTGSIAEIHSKGDVSGGTASNSSPQPRYAFFPDDISNSQTLRSYKKFDVEPGEKLYIVVDAAVGGTGNNPSFSVIAWCRDADIAFTGSGIVSDTATLGTWSTFTFEMTIPGGSTSECYSIGVRRNSGAGKDLYITGLKIYRKNGHVLIQDGTLTADMVGTNEIIANTANIKDGVITSAKIGTAQIKTANIEDAAITNAKISSIEADKLTVGIAKNMLENSDFLQGFLGLDTFSNGTVGTGATFDIRDDGSDFGDSFSPSLRLRSLSPSVSGSGWIGAGFKPTNNGGSLGNGYPIEPSGYYEFSASFSVRRARAVVRIYWYQADGVTPSVENTYSTAYDRDENGNYHTGHRSIWGREGSIVQAPSDARYAVPEFRIIEANSAGSSNIVDAHIWQPLFAQVKNASVPLSYYQTGGVTQIDGGRIVADSITAATGAIADLAVGRLKLGTGAVTELVRLSKTDTTSVSNGAGTLGGLSTGMNLEYAANGTSNMHEITSADLTYSVPASNPPEKLLIQPTVRFGFTYSYSSATTGTLINLAGGIKVRIGSTDILGYLHPSQNYSAHVDQGYTFSLNYSRPDVLLELGSDYAAGNVIRFEVFIYRAGYTTTGVNMREFTVDIMEFYK